LNLSAKLHPVQKHETDLESRGGFGRFAVKTCTCKKPNCAEPKKKTFGLRRSVRIYLGHQMVTSKKKTYSVFLFLFSGTHPRTIPTADGHRRWLALVREVLRHPVHAALHLRLLDRHVLVRRKKYYKKKLFFKNNF